MTALDPEVAHLLATIAASNPPPLETLSPSAARAAMDQMAEFLFPAVPPVAMETIAPDSAAVPRVRSYRPQLSEESRLPALVFLHGGGWVLGSLDCYDSLCATIAHQAGLCVIAVDYRLAPEAPFPAAFDDGVAALQWIADHAATLRIDPERVAIGGDSAGAALAVSVALAARDVHRPALRGMVLLYPVTDIADEAPSYVENCDGYVLTAAAMRWFRGHYLTCEDDASDWRASPLRAPDLSGLPAAVILTCGFDPLRDEGIALADRLAGAGVPVTHRHIPDQVHGFLMWGRVVSAANREMSEISRLLRSMLDHA